MGSETASRPYVNSEIQASLRDTLKNKHNGLIAVIRDNIYSQMYTASTCSGCGCSVRTVNTYYHTKYLPNLLLKNSKYNGENCHYNDSEVYCTIVQYSTFLEDPEKYINEAFDKRDNCSLTIYKMPGSGTPGIGK